MKEYALYKGDEFLEIGTIEEIAKSQGVRVDTIYFYNTKAYKKRLAERNSDNAKVLIPLD